MLLSPYSSSIIPQRHFDQRISPQDTFMRKCWNINAFNVDIKVCIFFWGLLSFRGVLGWGVFIRKVAFLISEFQFFGAKRAQKCQGDRGSNLSTSSDWDLPINRVLFGREVMCIVPYRWNWYCCYCCPYCLLLVTGVVVVVVAERSVIDLGSGNWFYESKSSHGI